MKQLFASFAFLALLSTTARADDTRWVADYDEAVKIAKAERKHLLVDFTGSDWCGWCIRLHDEVFDHAAFSDPITKDFVLVSLDFPRGKSAKAKVPNPKRNGALAKLHKVSGYPTVLLMTADGEVYGRTGYQAGGPEAYVKHLHGLRRKGMAALNAIRMVVTTFEVAEGEARVPALVAVMDLLEKQDDDSAFGGLLAAPIKSSWGILPTESQPRAIFLLNEAGHADQSTLDAGKKLDPENKLGLYADSLNAFLEALQDEKTIPAALKELDAFTDSGFAVEDEVAESLYLMGAYWNTEEFADNSKASKRYAALGLKVTRQPRYKAFFKQILEED